MDSLEIFEIFCEFFLGTVGLAVVCLALRMTIRLTLPYQRRALRVLLCAVGLFVSLELFQGVDTLFLGGVVPEAALVLPHEVAEIALVVCVGVSMYLMHKSNSTEVASLRYSADFDSLTGLNNQTFFRRAASRRFSNAKKYGSPLVCVMLDLDDFKEYNDLFGHESGNIALRYIAEVLREVKRVEDLAARYGGEEFILLVGNSYEEAIEFAERLRSEVESRCSPRQDVPVLRQITASVGLASTNAQTETLASLIEAADTAMYRAKDAGKNSVSAV